MLANVRAFMQRISGSPSARVLRIVLLVLSLLLGSYWLVTCVDRFYSIKQWLIWRYCSYWLGAAFYTLACQMGGMPIVYRLGRDFRHAERLLLAQAAGMVLFFLGMFGLGMLRLYYWPVFILWPLMLMAYGARTSLRVAKRLWRVRRVMYRRPRPPRSLLQVVALGLGLVSLLIVYSQIIHPLNTSYDARWYHLSLAEQYTAQGRIMRFPNASFVNAYPQLASILYSWAFLAPRAVLFDKLGLCAHMVFVMFGWILASVAVLTRRLVKNPSPVVWATVFLFPGLFLYDSGLHLGSDHAAAVFAVPIALTSYVAFKSWRTRNWLLLALMVSGAALTKYSAVTLFAVPALALLSRGAVGLVRDRFHRASSWLGPPALSALVALVLTAPHWAKNWAYYGNPVLPYAASFFKQPWSDYNRRFYVTWQSLEEWVPKGSFRQRLDETIHAVPFFAFEPHDWPSFHRDVPVFGFLFSLSGLALPFVRGRTQRIWVLMLATYCGVFLWYWGMHQDRYLQVLLPWMAAATAAILALAWRTSVWAKLPVLGLVVLQIAWGSDVPFIPTHGMLGKPPTTAAIELASTGYRQQVRGRLNVFEPWQTMSKALDPRTSSVLLHDQQVALGIGAMVVQDFPHMQGLIDFGSQRSLGGAYRMLKDAGITHLVWRPKQTTGWYGYSGDLIFFDLLRSHTGEPQAFGGNHLAKLVPGPDLDVRDAKVAFFVCPCPFGSGLYSLQSLNFPDVVVSDAKKFPKPEVPFQAPDEPEALIARARYVVFEPSCNATTPSMLKRSFSHLATRDAVQLWARNEPKLSDED
jgi:hypothetical protein